MWKSLLTSTEDVFLVGSIFRCPADWPYENFVDFMLIHNIYSPSELSILVMSGFKSGRILINLPLECKTTSGYAIDTEWIKLNWNKWIYEKGPEGVMVFEQRFIQDVNSEP